MGEEGLTSLFTPSPCMHVLIFKVDDFIISVVSLLVRVIDHAFPSTFIFYSSKTVAE